MVHIISDRILPTSSLEDEGKPSLAILKDFPSLGAKAVNFFLRCLSDPWMDLLWIRIHWLVHNDQWLSIYNSKCWKVVFRTFPFMGMFDWEGVLIPVDQWGKSSTTCIILDRYMYGPVSQFLLRVRLSSSYYQSMTVKHHSDTIATETLIYSYPCPSIINYYDCTWTEGIVAVVQGEKGIIWIGLEIIQFADDSFAPPFTIISWAIMYSHCNTFFFIFGFPSGPHRISNGIAPKSCKWKATNSLYTYYLWHILLQNLVKANYSQIRSLLREAIRPHTILLLYMPRATCNNFLQVLHRWPDNMVEKAWGLVM